LAQVGILACNFIQFRLQVDILACNFMQFQLQISILVRGLIQLRLQVVFLAGEVRDIAAELITQSLQTLALERQRGILCFSPQPEMAQKARDEFLMALWFHRDKRENWRDDE